MKDKCENCGGVYTIHRSGLCQQCRTKTCSQFGCAEKYVQRQITNIYCAKHQAAYRDRMKVASKAQTGAMA